MKKHGQSLSLAFYLAVVAAALAIPFSIFVYVLLDQLAKREERALSQQSSSIASTIAIAVGHNLRDMATTLRILASSEALGRGDLAAMHRRTQQAVAGSAWNLLAIDNQGRQLLNTRVAFGTPLGNTTNMEAFHEAAEQNRVVASNVFFGETSQRWVFNVIQPTSESNNEVVSALILTQEAAELVRLLTATVIPDNWTAVVVDKGATIVASTDLQKLPHGSILPAELNTYSAIIEGEGGNLMVKSVEVAGWAWKVVVWGPVSTQRSSLLSIWQPLLGAGVALAAFSALLVFILAIRLGSSIRGLSGMAQFIGAGDVAPPIRTGIRELDEVAISLSLASFDRSQAENKLVLVTRELIHRTKNMLTVLQAMIRQSARNYPNSNDFIPVITQRIAGLAKSIDLLTERHWEGVPLENLVREQLSSFIVGTERIEVTGEPIVLRPEAVQNLGLVFHELATNSVKYGALSNLHGKVRISWFDQVSDYRSVFVLRWEELDGPEREGSSELRSGFGTTIIVKYAENAFRGVVSYELRPGGAFWQLTMTRDAVELESAQGHHDPSAKA